MKAAVLKTQGSPLVIEDIADPTPGPEDLILKVGACGICGTDLHWSENTDPSVGWRVLAPDTVMGHEFAGEVVEVGRDVRGQWKAGDRVVAQPFIGCGRCDACRTGRGYRCAEVTMRASGALPGAYAEYTRVGSATSLRLPSGLDFRHGALVEPLAVGLGAVNRAGLAPRDSVLIIGAGPVGLSVALWCRFVGAHHIIVSDLVAQRAARAAAFGATDAIDASREDVAARVKQIAGGPPTVVFDCVGVPGSLGLAIDYAGFDARVIVVGLCMAGDQLYPTRALVKELDVKFSFIYRLQDFRTTIEMMDNGRIDPSEMITERVDMGGFSTAFEALKKPTDQIKVMLEPG